MDYDELIKQQLSRYSIIPCSVAQGRRTDLIPGGPGIGGLLSHNQIKLFSAKAKAPVPMVTVNQFGVNS
jgi:hypothetical protein